MEQEKFFLWWMYSIKFQSGFVFDTDYFVGSTVSIIYDYPPNGTEQLGPLHRTGINLLMQIQ